MDSGSRESVRFRVPIPSYAPEEGMPRRTGVLQCTSLRRRGPEAIHGGSLTRPFVRTPLHSRIDGMALPARTRIARCCFCRGMMRVSARALSVSCPHCHKQISLEDLRIIGSHPGKTLATCGDVVVEQSARLNVALTARRVTVLGRVNGPIKGGEFVEIGTTGHVRGDIEAPKIVVRDGAMIEGVCRMTAAPPTEEDCDAALGAGGEINGEDLPDAGGCGEDISDDSPSGPRPLRRPGA